MTGGGSWARGGSIAASFPNPLGLPPVQIWRPYMYMYAPSLLRGCSVKKYRPKNSYMVERMTASILSSVHKILMGRKCYFACWMCRASPLFFLFSRSASLNLQASVGATMGLCNPPPTHAKRKQWTFTSTASALSSTMPDENGISIFRMEHRQHFYRRSFL